MTYKSSAKRAHRSLYSYAGQSVFAEGGYPLTVIGTDIVMG
jgi:hypothetical protein